MKKVILTALAGTIFTQVKNEDGSPKLDKNGKPFGYIRVENPSEIDLLFAYNNAGVKRGQSALVAMSVEAWEKNGKFYKEDMEIAGRVKIIESLEKGKGFQEKMAGKGDNTIPCTINGKQIYRITTFVPFGAKDKQGNLISDEDILIAHDNGEAISALAKSSSVEALNAA